MAQKFIELLNGKLKQKEATVVSTGAPSGGAVVSLDSSGRLDPSVMPVGIGADVAVLEASENLNAGNYVNIYDDGGVPKVRLADNSNGRDAHGFVKDVYPLGSNASVYFEGSNDDLASLTAGNRYYLGTAGGVTATAPTAPAAQISQFVGIAINSTTINVDIDDTVGLV